MTITYSIIIPLKNEEGNIQTLVEEIESVMLLQAGAWEMICVDDGSTDNTLTILRELKRSKKYLRLVIFAHNYGQTSAFDAGFKAAKGQFIITLDGDRQNDPKDIPKLIEMCASYDLVCGIREKRRDTFFKRMISLCANWVRSRVCGDGIKDTGCSLKIYRSACLKNIKLYQGMHRFLPALFLIEGYKIGQIPVSHRERASGKTKYTLFNRSFNTIADMLAVRWMKRRKLGYSIKEEIS